MTAPETNPHPQATPPAAPAPDHAAAANAPPPADAIPPAGWRRVLFFFKVLEIRLRFVLALLVAFLVVGYWDHVVNFYERWTRPAAQSQAENPWEYVCSMHPYIVSDHPGICPVSGCGMDLIRQAKGTAALAAKGGRVRLQIAPERLVEAGIATDTVDYRQLTRVIRSYGTVDVDETRQSRIIARFPGRVDELIVNAVGLEVKHGDPLARIYSPKYLAASLEYIQALDAEQRAKQDPAATADARQLAHELAVNARRPLELAGFTPAQLDELVRTRKAADHVTLTSSLAGTVLQNNVRVGDQVDESTVLYTIADLSTVWVQAQIIESDLSSIQIGMPVEVTSVAWPGEIFYGTVDLIYPTVSEGNRAVQARLAINNRSRRLRPGMYVTTVIRAPLGRSGPANQTAAADGGAAAPITRLERKPQTRCPVSGDELGKMGPPREMHVGDRTIYLCCGGCVDKFNADPQKYVAIVDAATQPDTSASGASTTQWIEGYACPMHPDELKSEGGRCTECDCGMDRILWRIEKVLAVPETAVIDTGIHTYVYRETAMHTFQPFDVTLGSRAGDYYPVLNGLQAGDKIVTRGAFLIDAEALLRPTFAPAEDAPAAPAPTPATPSNAAPTNMSPMPATPPAPAPATPPADPHAGHHH